MTPDAIAGRFPSLFQATLLPACEDDSPVSERHKKFLAVIDMAGFASLGIVNRHEGIGRPPKDRIAIARAFAAKAVWNLQTTRDPLDRLMVDKRLRRMCGWVFHYEVPSEATFWRAFAGFAECGLPALVHEAIVKWAYEGRLVGRDVAGLQAAH